MPGKQVFLYCQRCNRAYGVPPNFSQTKPYHCQRCKQVLTLVQKNLPPSPPPSQSSGITTPYYGDGSEDKTRDPLFQPQSKLPHISSITTGSILTSSTGNRFQVLDILGEGGAGRVYEVRDGFLKRPMALKMILENKALDELTKKRFLREIFVTSKLDHPNITPIYDGGNLKDGSLFLLMKKIKGGTLKELLAPKKSGKRKFPLRKLLEFFLKACDGVSYAHSKGVIHRDLKPSNIAVGSFGEVIIMDWGLAKFLGEAEEIKTGGPISESMDEELSMDGSMLGTPAYMPPEQANGRHDLVGIQSDIYSLGAVLYHILTLVSPFKGNPREILSNLLMKDPLSPRKRKPGLNIPKPLSSIVMKSLSKKVEDRYQSITDMAEDIQNFLDDKPVSVYTPPFQERMTRWMSRHLAALGVAFFICVLIAIFGYFLALEGQRRLKEQKKTIEAQSEREKFYKEKIKAEQSAKEEKQKKLEAQKKQRKLLLARIQAEEEKIKLQKKQEIYRKKMLKAYGPYLSARNQMANNLRYSHLQKNVIPLLQKALAIQPKFVEARLELIKIYGYLSRQKALFAEMTKLAKSFPKKEEAKISKLITPFLFAMATGRDTSKIEIPSNIEDLHPAFLPNIYWITLKAYMFYGFRKYRYVIGEIDKALRTSEGQIWEMYYLKAMCHRQLGENQKAIKVLTKIIKIYPHIPYPYGNRAVILYKFGRVKEAMGDFQKAISIDSSYFIVWSLLGNIALRDVYKYKRRKIRGAPYLSSLLMALRYFELARTQGLKTHVLLRKISRCQSLLLSYFGQSKKSTKSQGAILLAIYQMTLKSPSLLLKREWAFFALALSRDQKDFRLAQYALRFKGWALKYLKEFQKKYPKSLDRVWILKEFRR